MMTLSALRTEILTAVGNRDDITSAQLNQFINWAYRFVWNRMPHHQKEDLDTSVTTTSGQQYVDLPANTYAVLTVRVDSQRLDKMSRTEYFNIESPDSGVPTRYWVMGTRLYFDTEPDDEYDVEIFRIKRLTELSGDSDTLSLPDEVYETALVSQAIAYAWRHLNQPQVATLWFQNARIDIDEARRADQDEFDDYNQSDNTGGVQLADYRAKSTTN